MTRRPNIELFQHGAAHSRKASAEPHWENESSGHSVIWSASSLAKFIRHPTTAIGQLTFGSRDRPVSRLGNRQVYDPPGSRSETPRAVIDRPYRNWNIKGASDH